MKPDFLFFQLLTKPSITSQRKHDVKILLIRIIVLWYFTMQIHQKIGGFHKIRKNDCFIWKTQLYYTYSNK